MIDIAILTQQRYLQLDTQDPWQCQIALEEAWLAQALRAQGIAARIGLSASNPGKHLQYAEAAGLEWIVFVGEDEVSKGLYPLRQLSSRSEERLSIDGLIERLRGLPA